MALFEKRIDMTPAAVWRRRSSISDGVFRCVRCDRVMPESQLIEQDGSNLCKPYCATPTSKAELDMAVADILGTVDDYEPNALPVMNVTAGAVAVTSWSVARPMTIARGATLAVTLTGVNFTAALTITYDDANITNSVGPTLTGTTIANFTISVGASAAVGWHTITVFGDTYFNCLRVV